MDNLGTYLNDHLGGATGGRELAKRALSSNRGTEFEPMLEWLVEQIVEDRQVLIDIIHAVGARRDQLKSFAAMAAERAGRLKLNNSLFSYSPLSRLIEFEGLTLGVTGKLSGWRVLQELNDPRLADFDLELLVQRAIEQRERVEKSRRAAALLAFQR